MQFPRIESNHLYQLTSSAVSFPKDILVSPLRLPLPNGLIKVRRRWGQRHPQGANSGSNGKLELMPNSKWLPPAHPNPLLAMSTRAAHFDLPLLTGLPSQQQAKHFNALLGATMSAAEQHHRNPTHLYGINRFHQAHQWGAGGDKPPRPEPT
jgi:hypothetical protein